MNFAMILKPFAAIGRKTSLFWKAHGAAIQTGASIGLGVASTVTACVATTKLEGVVDEHKERIDNLKASLAAEPPIITEQEYKTELRKTYAHTAKEVGKLYWLPALLQVGSALCSIGSYRQLRADNLALGAAYIGLDKAYKALKAKSGEEQKDVVFVESAEKAELPEPSTQPDGYATYDLDTLAGEELSPYARMITKGNPIYDDDVERMLATIRKFQTYLEDEKITDGWVYLERAYKYMHLEASEASAAVGWARYGDGDDQILIKTIVLNGGEAYIVDFNVDGPLRYLYKGRKF